MDQVLAERIQAYVYHREYDPRQIVFFPHDACDYVYWVREGRVKISRVSPDGRELTFRHLFRGDMMGEEVLGGQTTWQDYAEAVVTTTLCLLRADDFLRLAEEEAEFACAVARRLSERVLQTEQTLSETVFRSVRSRVASGLLRLYNKQDGATENIVRVTHQEVANLVGSTRETTTSVLHQLRAEGIVELGNRRVTVLDLAALEHVTHAG